MRSQFQRAGLEGEQKAPAAPTAASSVAVVISNRITASTATVRMPSGITDAISMRSNSNLLDAHLT